MKRQTKRLLAAILVVAVLAGVYAVLLRNPKSEENENKGASAVTTIDSDRVTEIAVQLKNQEPFAVQFETDDSGTVCTMRDGDPTAHYDENRMTQLLSTATAVTGTLIEPSCKELDKYGLDDTAQVSSVAITADGMETTLLFGMTSEALEGTYCRNADNRDVYFISHDTAETLLAGQDEYLLLQVLTSYYSLSTDLQRMTVDSLHGVRFVIERRNTAELSDSEAAAFSKFVIIEPQKADADDTALSTGILSRLQEGLTAETVVQAGAAPEDLRQYGLDHPRAEILLQFANAKDTVLIGDTDGNIIYVMTKGGSTIFACKAGNFEWLENDDWRNYRSSDLLTFAKSQLKTIRLTTEEATHTAELTYLTADENREADTDTVTGTLDGTEMDSGAVNRLYAALKNLNYTAVQASASEGTTMLKLRVRLTDGTKHTVQFAKGGSREYLADVDGSGFVYTVSKADVDAVTAAFE